MRHTTQPDFLAHISFCRMGYITQPDFWHSFHPVERDTFIVWFLTPISFCGIAYITQPDFWRPFHSVKRDTYTPLFLAQYVILRNRIHYKDLFLAPISFCRQGYITQPGIHYTAWFSGTHYILWHGLIFLALTPSSPRCGQPEPGPHSQYNYGCRSRDYIIDTHFCSAHYAKHKPLRPLGLGNIISIQYVAPAYNIWWGGVWSMWAKTFHPSPGFPLMPGVYFCWGGRGKGVHGKSCQKTFVVRTVENLEFWNLMDRGAGDFILIVKNLSRLKNFLQ